MRLIDLLKPKRHNMENEVDAILIHIDHSKPIEINEFTTALNAAGNLFSSFVQEKGNSRELAQAKLYVEKIEEGCIDIFLCETVTACLLPFMENMNVIFDFSAYLKNIFGFYKSGKGEKPDLKLQEAKNLKDLLNITANDNLGEMTIGAISKSDKGNIFNNCTFNFIESNSTQNQLEKEIESLKSVQPDGKVHTRCLMTIYQMRSDMGSDIGNKAIIESISPKRVGVVFASDELKEKILHSDDNPTKRAYQVDVETLFVENRLVGYNVLALHDIMPLD